MRPFPLALALVALTALSGCDLAGDVLEFGFWTGIVVVALIAVAAWFVVRAFKR